MQSFEFNVGEEPYVTHFITINDSAYNLTVRYNGRRGRWCMDLVDASTGEYLWRGLKLMPNSYQTDFTQPDFQANTGLFTVNLKGFNGDTGAVDRDNLGISVRKTHALGFVDAEMLEYTEELLNS